MKQDHTDMVEKRLKDISNVMDVLHHIWTHKSYKSSHPNLDDKLNTQLGEMDYLEELHRLLHVSDT